MNNHILNENSITQHLYNNNIISERDAFGRFRVSNPVTLFESHHVYDKSPLEYDEIIQNGATSYHDNNSFVELKTDTTVNSKCIRQSKQYIPYQPGKSKLIMLTGVLETSGGITGVRTRIGTFDDHNDKVTDSGGNGLFFELDGKKLYVVERFSTDGTGQTENRVEQANWNIDSFGDGTLNPSKKKLTDYSKSYIFVIDLEWLGVGISRFGVVFNGKIHYCHVFNHKKINKPYIRTAKLPIRFEIQNFSSSSIARMRQICATAISEGGYNLSGVQFSGGMGATIVNDIGSSTFRPLCSLKLKDLYIRGTIYLKNIHSISLDNKPIFFKVTLNSTLTGTSFVNVNENSIAMIDTGATAISNDGVEISSGYVSGKSTTNLVSSIDDLLHIIPICSTITGQSDIITVSAKSTNTASFAVNLEWLEIK